MTRQSKKKALAPQKQSLLSEYEGGKDADSQDLTFPDKTKEKMITLCSQDNSHPDDVLNVNKYDVPEGTVKSSVLIKMEGGPQGIAEQLKTKYEAVNDYQFEKYGLSNPWVGMSVKNSSDLNAHPYFEKRYQNYKWNKDDNENFVFHGLSEENDATINSRSKTFGSNAFIPPVIKSLWELILENFEDQINQILLVAAIVSIIIGLIQHWPNIAEGMLEGTSIMIALTIIIVVSSGNNYISEKKLGELVKSSAAQKVAVYRHGETQTIDYQLLQVGDVYKLEDGMKIPADSLLVEGNQVECDEADLTGEPDHKKKIVHTEHEVKDKWRGNKSTSIMYASCLCTKGTGKALVLSVGSNTVQGTAAKKASGEEEDDDKSAEMREKKNADKQTLLQKKLNTIASTIGNLGYACAILTFSAIAIRMAVEYFGGLPCGCKNLVTCEVPDANEVCPGIDFSVFGSRAYTELLGAIIIAITVIVVAIPEGLPLAVTISLSVASAIMQQEKNLVRNLKSAETMGQVTHLVSDKTGTLTKNEMNTMTVMTGNKVFAINGKVNDASKKKLVEEAKQYLGDNWHVLEEGVLWNSDATRIEKKSDDKIKEEILNGINNPNKMGLNGNVTEMGLLKFFLALFTTETLDEDYHALQGVRDKLTKEALLASFRFNSARKMCSMAIKTGDDEVTIFAKGAPDILYKHSTQVLALDEDGNAVTREWEDVCDDVSGVEGCPEGATYKEMYAQCTTNFAKHAYRTILVCRKVLTMDQWEQMKADNGGFETQESMVCFEEDLEVLGLFGIQDPLREAIVGSVQQVNKAGITVIMCTGDNLDTAIAISKNAGIVTDEQINKSEDSKRFTCMQGSEFRTYVYELNTEDEDYATKLAGCGSGQLLNFNQTLFNRMIPHLKVMARSTPIDKYLLVKGLQKAPYYPIDSTEILEDEGNLCCVAVTGDGTNDAPALKKANVGFAMNIGTDVAKAASDIILLENNFSHIVTALRYGRNIFDNIRKFLQFQLTVNVVAMFIVFFGSVILNSSPLTAVQMLWVNLIMDTFAALALATEPPDSSILLRKPQPSSQAITTQVMWRNILGHSIYQIIVLVCIIFVSQGTLLPHYDIKCIGDRAADSTCPQGQLNPFYASNRYFYLNTEKYWTSDVALKWDVDNFEKDLFIQYNCDNLRKEFGGRDTATDEKAFAECTLKTVKDLVMFPVDKTENRGLSTVSDTPENVEEKVFKNKRRDDGVYLPQYQSKGDETPMLLHMTYLFQIFVFMQLFNQINARMLKVDEWNIFKGIFDNKYFVLVAIITFVVQMVMVEVGGQITKTIPLTMEQNGICALIGSGELIWGLFLKLMPLKLFQFQFLQFNEKPMTQQEEQASVKGRLKASSSHHKKDVANIRAKLDKKIQDNMKRKISTSINDA